MLAVVRFFGISLHRRRVSLSRSLGEMNEMNEMNEMKIEMHQKQNEIVIRTYVALSESHKFYLFSVERSSLIYRELIYVYILLSGSCRSHTRYASHLQKAEDTTKQWG